ncbi:unnamed protein product [Adineta steineri]|uniref:Methyltransferase type 11 domain-containing protein n=1 Tax=Adineta steineri TaxID=433720 RepID=A0A813YAW7_9BILA|nr:unnamed protein product [Adineta steineri]CAF4091345.1 unnamed protein product [Adineta steineri]
MNLSKFDFTRLKNLLPSSLKSLSINPTSDLIREDENNDTEFYSTPRFVHHIDDRARYVLSQFYTYAIQQTPETITLDLCSSWTSHLPENFIGKVFGLGMNELELKENPSLNQGYTVQDLNQNPSLPKFSSNTFDSVICSVSIDYLIHPLKIFNEVGRILKPNGLFITSFSNRCFPTKVIRKWLYMNELQRVEWVANYFLQTDTYFNPMTIKAYSFFDGNFLPITDEHYVDPMYIVSANKK